MKTLSLWHVYLGVVHPAPKTVRNILDYHRFLVKEYGSLKGLTIIRAFSLEDATEKFNNRNRKLGWIEMIHLILF